MEGTSAQAYVCGWCGTQHGPRCPIVKAIEYDKQGRIRRVEFVCATPAQELIINTNGKLPLENIPDVITFK